MPTAVSGALSLIAVVAMMAGIFLSRHALARYGAPSAPKGVFWRPRDWRPVWKARDWFVEDKGYRFFWVSCLLLSGGGLLVFLVFAFRL
jgi:hypothetical protein